MERPQYTSIPREELRRIEAETQRAESIEDLRALFDRLQAIRRTFIDDFDVQLAISHVQQSVVERGRVLLERGHDYQQGFDFTASRAAPPSHFQPGEEAARDTEAGPQHETSELPPHVQKIDAHTWKRATYIGAALAILLFAVFFYLIQTARRFNFASEEPPKSGECRQYQLPKAEAGHSSEWSDRCNGQTGAPALYGPGAGDGHD